MFGTERTLPTLIFFLQLFNLHTARARPSLEGRDLLSASALADSSHLKFEIIAIVLAYLFFTSILLTLVFTVGRRRRRRLHLSGGTPDREMIAPTRRLQPTAFSVDPSPISPQKQWPSPVGSEIKPWTSPTGKHYYHPSQNSMSTLDEKAVDRDRIRNQDDDLERIYAAVLAHDEQKASQQQMPTAASPPELQHLRTSGLHITQPRNPAPSELSPTEPRSPTLSRASSRLTKASPLSIFQSNHSRTSSAASQKHRSRRISVRDLSISSPMGTSDLVRSAAYSEDQPLSPRVYTPGPPPPTPGKESEDTPQQKTWFSRAPAPAPIQTQAESQPRTLPFRQHYTTQSQRSAPPTKTTFVERRESLLYPGGRGPKTGLPPCSPWDPRTPLTPMTPSHLVTREDRKKAKKQAGLKVLAEDEMVRSEQELWGDSWKG